MRQKDGRIGARPARLARGNGCRCRRRRRCRAAHPSARAGRRRHPNGRAGGAGRDADAEQEDAIAGRQPMHIEPEASAGPPCRPEHRSARTRSAGSVIFTLSSSPATSATAMPSASASAASSVIAAPTNRRCAQGSSRTRTLAASAPGTGRRARPPATTPPTPRFSVSVTGRTGSAAAQVRKACSTRSITVGLTKVGRRRESAPAPETVEAGFPDPIAPSPAWSGRPAPVRAPPAPRRRPRRARRRRGV